ncbi:hypothetical protein H5410_052391 [Solanum commersonii]|uniref:DUF4283 domain-containing protein n=1 Tax=Solanum commersonii TaxID=4109 RepID=A0A9J5X397_SOLCO|nr:hypothetical protein H5410_052391 [Solanum commersonii]
MATATVGQPPSGEVGPITQGITNTNGLPCTILMYANKVKAKSSQYMSVSMKQVAYLHGEPRIKWEGEEVEQMIINEDLQFAVIGKFSYEWPDIQDLRRLIPKQCELKGNVNIGLLSNTYVLIRTTLLEDYVTLLSKPQFYITKNHWSYPMRTLKWDPMFNPEEETSIAVDMATLNKTRPSCARVKNQCGSEEEDREVVKKWISIKYGYVPKYCNTCKLQGHNKKECFIIHPELYPKEDEEEIVRKKNNDNTETERTTIGKEDEVQQELNVFQIQRRKKGYRRGNYFDNGGRKDQKIVTTNMYEALEEGGDKEIGEASRGNKNGKQTTSEQEEPSKSTNEKGLFGEGADRNKEIADMEGIKRLNSTQNEGQIEASSGESKTLQSINLNQSVEGFREDDQRDSNEDIGSSHSTKSSPRQHYNRNKEDMMGLTEREKSNGEQTNINSPTQQEKQQKQDKEEDECIEANIESW